MTELTLDVTAPPRARRRASPSPAAAPTPPPKTVSWTMVSFIGALFIQSSAAIWWAAKTDTRVGSIESAMAPLKDLAPMVARIDERTSRTGRDVDDMKVWIRRVSDRGRGPAPQPQF